MGDFLTPTDAANAPKFSGVDLSNEGDPSWIFPPALKKDFIEDIFAQLPLPNVFSSERERMAPSPFDAWARRPDLILDAVYNMTFEERLNDEDAIVGLRREDVVIWSGDNLKLEWSGGKKSVVGMTCHKCDSYNMDGSNIKEACADFTKEYDVHPFGASIINDQAEMNVRFEHLSNVATNGVNVALESGYSLSMPSLTVQTWNKTHADGGAICMFTLGEDVGTWEDETIPKTRHSIPIFLVTTARKAPRPIEGTSTPWPYEYSSRYPEGRPMMKDTDPGGTRFGQNDPSPPGPTEHVEEKPGENEGGASSSMNAGVIAGLVVAMVIALTGLALAVWFVRLRKSRRQHSCEIETSGKDNDRSSAAVETEDVAVVSSRKETEDEKDQASIKTDSDRSSVRSAPPAYHEATAHTS